MKTIKFLIIIFIQLSVFSNMSAQAEVIYDENGRLMGATPVVPTATNENNSTSTDVWSGSDEDIPGAPKVEPEDVFYGSNPTPSPIDMDIMALNEDIIAKVEALQAELDELRLQNEQLLLENVTIRKGMENCCVENGSLGVTNSFLLQNAPNPFNKVTEIQYFLPDNTADAKIEVRSINGELLKSYELETEGLGKLSINGEAFAVGSYVYTLSIGGKLIDSKVMILTK